MSLSDFDIHTRYLVNHCFTSLGQVPTIDKLAEMHDCSIDEIEQSLIRLELDHRLLLYPGTHDVWVAHPFSAVATSYWVTSGKWGWWGNCAFCSLGIAAMLRANATIKAQFGAEANPVTLEVVDGELVCEDMFIHVPLPIARWHDNVVYTCGNVHFFASHQALDEWCSRHSVSKGEILPIASAWQLAKGWYGEYLSESWQPRTNAQTNELLRKCGLNSEFWRLPEEPVDVSRLTRNDDAKS